MKRHFLSFAIAVSALSACSSDFWYTQIQGAQYDKCEHLTSAEERRRCKAETYPDKEKYDKERQATRGVKP